MAGGSAEGELGSLPPKSWWSAAVAAAVVERQVVELYGQAVEQLGHDRATVRIGGLYALERLAQGHPEFRQTVIDVVCAYLRMPFQPPVDDTAPEAEQEPIPNGASPVVPQPPRAAADQAETKQELQVRLAAQGLLARHLTVPVAEDPTDEADTPPETFWAGMRIDLSSAVLVDFDFSRCRPTRVDFRKAHFSGNTWFHGVQFEGAARFDRAYFSGYTWFTEAHFQGNARFFGTRFDAGTWFGQARFCGAAGFDGSQFGGEAAFPGVWFNGYASFGGARFGGDVGFVGAQFSRAAGFDGARFTGDAEFSDVRFSGDDARFGGAQFSREPDFAEATASYPDDRHEWPGDWYVEPHSPEDTTGRLVRRSDADGAGGAGGVGGSDGGLGFTGPD